MSWSRLGAIVGWVLVLCCSCSAPDRSPPKLGAAGAAGRASGGQSSSGGSAGGGPETGGRAGAPGAGGSAGSSGSAGSFDFVISDLADAPCVTTTATPTVVMEPEPLQIVYDRMGHVADRVFAFDSGTLALFTFDVSGAEPSPIRYDDLLAVAPLGDKLAVLRMSGTEDVVLELADSRAAGSGTPLSLATGPSAAHQIGVGPELLLVMRRSGTRLEGELVRRDGSAIVAAFDLGADSCGAANCKGAAVWNGVGYTLVWSRVLQDQRSKLSWVRVSNAGQWELVKTIALTSQALELVDLLRLADGYALLLSEGVPAEAPIVARLDDYGNPRGAALRLLGARDAWAMASVASGLGVVAQLADGRAAFRPLDISGEALASWVCLDDSAPDIGFHSRASIADDGDGFDFVVRMTDGSAAYLRSDALGMAR